MKISFYIHIYKINNVAIIPPWEVWIFEKFNLHGFRKRMTIFCGFITFNWMPLGYYFLTKFLKKYTCFSLPLLISSSEILFLSKFGELCLGLSKRQSPLSFLTNGLNHEFSQHRQCSLHGPRKRNPPTWYIDFGIRPYSLLIHWSGNFVQHISNFQAEVRWRAPGRNVDQFMETHIATAYL